MTRKSQYGWMVVGGILCLCGGVVALKLREGNPAAAQTDPVMGPTAAANDRESAPEDGSKKPTPETLPPVAPPGPADAPPLPPPPPGGDKLEPPGPPLPAVGLAPLPPPAVDPVNLPPSGPPSLPPPPLPPAAPVEAALPSVNLPPADDENAKAPVHDVPLAPPQGPVAASPAPKMMPPAEVVQVSQVGEPPLAGSGPLQSYQVRNNGETVRDITRRTLGTGERCAEVCRLNPSLRPEESLTAGTVVHLPQDACLPADEVEGIKPLPAMRPKTAPAKPRAVMALTGTYPCNVDDKRGIALPRAVREQFGDAETLLASPGPDQCLWLTDPSHQERLAERLEHSPAREVDVRVFKRLYYAQTEKVAVGGDGRITLSDRLAQFAGLSQEVVLVGIDDHFELWDAARWKQYTQVKSAAAGSE